jgi:putative ABC transport system substrate-binding protein
MKPRIQFLRRRREFISVLGGAAAWPLAARAQQLAMPVIGFLRSTSLADSALFVTTFRQGLKESGFVEGQNVAIDLRFAEGRSDRLPELVADLIHKSVTVIVANDPAAVAAKAATITVPIVFITGSDPVREGLVASLNRPGGNVTGVVFISSELGAKRLELLRQLVAKAATIGVLVNPNTPETETERRDLLAASLKIGQQLSILDVGSDSEIDATLVQRGAGAALIGSGPFLTSHRQQLVALAARSRLPTMYSLRDFVAVGGQATALALPKHTAKLAFTLGRFSRGEADRLTGHAVNQVRIRPQSQDRKVSRPRSTSNTYRARRRGD